MSEKPDREWPLLAVAAGFLLLGAGAAWSKLSDRELSYALAAAGLVCLGVWLALEVRRAVLILKMVEEQDREKDVDDG